MVVMLQYWFGDMEYKKYGEEMKEEKKREEYVEKGKNVKFSAKNYFLGKMRYRMLFYSNSLLYESTFKQAEAELGQAQFQLR